MASGLGNLRFKLQLGSNISSDNDRLLLNSAGRSHSVNGILLIPGGRRRQTPNPNFLSCLHELMSEEIDHCTPTLLGNKVRFRRDVIPRLLFRVHIVLGSYDHRCNIDDLNDLQQLFTEIQIRGFVYRFVVEGYSSQLEIPWNCSNLDHITLASRHHHQQQQHTDDENHQNNSNYNHHNNNDNAPAAPPLDRPSNTTTPSTPGPRTGTTSLTIFRVPNVSPPPPSTGNVDDDDGHTTGSNNSNNDANNNISDSTQQPPSTPCPVCSNDTCPSCQRNKIKLCIICMENPVNHVIIPCGHLSLCQHCASHQILSLMSRSRDTNQPLCPDCRTPIERTIKVYGGRICQ